MQVVAEGVETSLQADELVRAGCDCGQGWHFGRPVRPRATDKAVQVAAALA
jgi:EAL domain-containing protein (putative c-di-GMP-specific phosphodiesterase class I)